MARKRDEIREQRIAMEAIVDAYGSSERSMGWYYYLDGKTNGPFKARCRFARPISPLKVKEEVEVLGMAPEEECEHEMFVLIQRKSHPLGVPLMQLEGIEVDEETQQAIDDWHYWVNRGFEL